MAAILIAGLILSPQRVTAQKKAIIKGSVSNADFKTATLYLVGKSVDLISSASIDSKGKYEISFNIAEPGFYKLQLSENQAMMLIAYPDDQIEIITTSADIHKGLRFANSPESQHILENQKAIDQFKADMDSIVNLSYNIGSINRDSLMEVYTREYETIENQQTEYLKTFMRKHPCSMACMFLIEALPPDAHSDVYIAVDSCMMKKAPNNPYIQNLHRQVQASLNLGVGRTAPDIALADTSGKIVSLSSLRGKYVLIDFWASWCGPCRAESPNMVRLYQKYQPKGFEIFGVSLDRDKGKWMKAIKDDKLFWTHVSDLKFWDSEGAKLYNVSSIPYTVLIDKEGRIVAKGLRGEPLFKKVEELVK